MGAGWDNFGLFSQNGLPDGSRPSLGHRRSGLSLDSHFVMFWYRHTSARAPDAFRSPVG